MGPLAALLLSVSIVSPAGREMAPPILLVQDAGYARHAELFRQAADAWSGGDRERATFWLYAAQLRFRSYLAANPGGDPSGAPALFASLMEGVGRPINEYAFGDIPALQRTIDEVLAWDAANPDASLPAATHRMTRDGLAGLRDRIGRDAASIRAERQRNGLPNR